MADIMNGRYALADPGSGLTVLSLEGGELNMFGSYTMIRTTQRDCYPLIHDEPTELKVENHIVAQLVTGLVVAAALAAVAVAVVATGGLAMAPLACALGGAAIGAGAVAIGTAVSDSETGYNRSWGEYWERLITGSCIGFIAGAAVYGLIAAVPAAASAAGVQAGMMFGTSTFTAVTVPGIVTAGGYGLAAAGGIYTANDIYSNSRGYNVILDKIFDDDIEAYETAGMVLDLFTEMYTNLGESNRALGNRSSNAAEEAGEEPPKKSVNTSDNDGNGKDDELSMNLNKGEEDKTNKGFESIGKGGNGQEENIDKRASEEGIIIEHKNNEDSVSRDQQDFKTSQIQLETYEFNNDAPEKDRVLCVNQVNQSVVVDSNKVRTSATSPFRGGETEAGHSFQKHGGRHPETWGKVSGGPEQINNTAMQHIEDILNAPGDFVVTTIDNLKFLEKRLPDGRGLRLNMDGTFKGFID